MKMQKQHAPLALAAAVVLLSACQKEMPYTITGTLDLPAEIPYGDTVIAVPSFEDTWVYLFDLDNQMVDSAQIQDNHFYFAGKVDPTDSYFVQLAMQMGQSLLVVEPGDIQVYIDRDDISITGTPSNDCICDIDAAMANLNNDTYAYLAELTDSLRNQGQELSDSITKQLSEDFRATIINVLDSAYQANKDNRGGVYAVLMRHLDAETSDEFEKAIADYPEEVRNNELLQLNLRMMRQYEQMYQQGSGLEGLDPSQFAPVEEGVAVPQQSAPNQNN